MRRRGKSTKRRSPRPEPVDEQAAETVLSHLDMSKRLEKRSFERELLKYQEDQVRQRRASRVERQDPSRSKAWMPRARAARFRRITAALDARDGQLIPIAAPTDEELAHHYLWRFWRHLPRAGRVTISFDVASGRLRAGRARRAAGQLRDEWRCVYAEINQFEDQLIDRGIALVKEPHPHHQRRAAPGSSKTGRALDVKSWKITAYVTRRNRAKWDAYEQAGHDMIERTSTRQAPWTLVEGNDKYDARIRICRWRAIGLCSCSNRILHLSALQAAGCGLPAMSGPKPEQQPPAA